jgi:LPXTG-site transpeptidase (sortase) family protein
VKRLFIGLLALGLALFAGGAGMRVHAQITMAQTKKRLIEARPLSAAQIENRARTFKPADGPPTRISIRTLGLWNALEPVDEQVEWQDGQFGLAWDVADAGWHIQSSWPGWGGNVVVAGHSPSRDPQTWPHSVFRQLAYLSPGDRIEVTDGKQIYVYEVSNVFAISGSEADTPNARAWLERGKSERLTLITCWPPHTAAYRVVVIALPTKA